MTSRVVTEESITRVREAVAPQININWDPVTNGGNVTFFLRDMITENGVYQGLERHKTLRGDANTGQMEGTMIVPMEDIMNATLHLESGDVPGYVLMVYIKAFFEQKYTELLNKQDAADAEASVPMLPLE